MSTFERVGFAKTEYSVKISMIASSTLFNKSLQKYWIILASLGIINAINDVRSSVLLISPPKIQRFMELLHISNRKILHMINACVIAFPTGNN